MRREGVLVLWAVLSAGAFTALIGAPAAQATTRQGLQAEAAALRGATTTETAGERSVVSADGLTRYYFSKPGNPVYPFAVSLHIEVKPSSSGKGCIDISLPMTTTAEDADDEAAEAADRWMAAIEESVLQEYAQAAHP